MLLTALLDMQVLRLHLQRTRTTLGQEMELFLAQFAQQAPTPFLEIQHLAFLAKVVFMVHMLAWHKHNALVHVTLDIIVHQVVQVRRNTHAAMQMSFAQLHQHLVHLHPQLFLQDITQFHLMHHTMLEVLSAHAAVVMVSHALLLILDDLV